MSLKKEIAAVSCKHKQRSETFGMASIATFVLGVLVGLATRAALTVSIDILFVTLCASAVFAMYSEHYDQRWLNGLPPADRDTIVRARREACRQAVTSIVL